MCTEKYPDESKEERYRTIQEAMKIYKQLKHLGKDVQWIIEDGKPIDCIAIDNEAIPSEIFFKLNGN